MTYQTVQVVHSLNIHHEPSPIRLRALHKGLFKTARQPVFVRYCAGAIFFESKLAFIVLRCAVLSSAWFSLTIHTECLPRGVHLWRRFLSEHVLLMELSVEALVAVSYLDVAYYWRCRGNGQLCGSSESIPVPPCLHHFIVCAAHLCSKLQRDPTTTPPMNIAALIMRHKIGMMSFRRTDDLVVPRRERKASSIEESPSSDSAGTRGRMSSGSFSMIEKRL